MSDLFVQPTLADFDNVVGVIVLIIAFLGWIMNLVSGKNKETPRTTERHNPRPAASRTERQENDVELFLEEVNERRQPRRQSRLKEQQTGPSAPTPQRPTQPAPSRPLVQKSEPIVLEVVETELGGGVRQHLQQYMTPNRIEEGVKQHLASSQELGKGVQQSVAELLKGNIPPGKQTALVRAAPTLGGNSSTSRAGVLAMLNNPQAVKQAILINEILSPPKARRPRQ